MRLEGEFLLLSMSAAQHVLQNSKRLKYFGSSNDNLCRCNAGHRLPGRAMCDGPFEFASKPANDDGSNGFLPHSPRALRDCPGKLKISFEGPNWLLTPGAGPSRQRRLKLGSLVECFFIFGIFGWISQRTKATTTVIALPSWRCCSSLAWAKKKPRYY